jgi:selenide, water dikinase
LCLVLCAISQLFAHSFTLALLYILHHSAYIYIYILHHSAYKKTKIKKQGRIGAANVLSDLYATGVADCDFMLMLLAASRDMEESHRRICTSEMVRGFSAACAEAGDTPITGGQTVLNPWPVIGGVATSVVSSPLDFCPLNQARPGHVVVLTKPLGTQVAVNVHQWRKRFEKAMMANSGKEEELHNNNNNNNSSNNDVKRWKKCVDTCSMTVEQAERMMHQAVCSMARLNRTAAQVMMSKSKSTMTKTTKTAATSTTETETTTSATSSVVSVSSSLIYSCSACTDVTGFGILGHAQNLADNQEQNVAIVIDTLPCIAGTMAVNDVVLNFRLRSGYSAETSGGLLLCLPSRDLAEQYCRELQQRDIKNNNAKNSEAWIVGRVVESATRKCEIVKDVEIIEV